MTVLSGVETLTFSMVQNFCVVLVALYGLNKILSEIIDKIGKYKKNKDKVENFDPEIIKSDVEKYLDVKHDAITKRYDGELKEIRETIKENHNDTAAKFQEVKEELYLQTECNAAIMDGLIQLKCNGPVTEAKTKLEQFLNQRAHDV